MSTDPYIFDAFFASNFDESVSPFLTKRSRGLASHFGLKAALVSTFLLLASFILSYFHPNISFILLSGVYLISGMPALVHAIEDLKELEINIEVLMTMAAFLSVIIGSGLEGGLLLVLFDLSGAMEQLVTRKTQSALNKLNDLTPSLASVIQEDGSLYQKAVKDIPTGTKLLIKAGEVVPLDGNVIAGHSSLNLSHLTGESLPVTKKEGDEVQAGSRNLDGSLTVLVTKTSRESTLTQIITMINEAQAMKPKLQRFLDRFGKVYATSIIALFFGFLLILPLLFHVPFLGLEGSVYRSLAFLIAASPCALIIATPTAYLSAISACARRGILLKGGVTLDALSRLKALAFDKTGTLTTGKLSCSKFVSLNPTSFSEKEALSVARSLERHINHPLALAIIEHAEEESAPLLEISGFRSLPGSGIEGDVVIEEKKVHALLGHADFVISRDPSLEKVIKSQVEDKDEMVSFLLLDQALYLFRFTDSLRPNILDVLKELQKTLKLKCIMLTGDHKTSANKIAGALALDEVYADLRPQHKLDLISKISKESPLGMVGDGINDAPALARADVGISMGKIGSGAAIDASDIVFLHDDLSYLSWLLKKASKTMRIVKQNITLALGVILLATTPALLGYLPLWVAVILHEGGTVLVGLNSLRLLK